LGIPTILDRVAQQVIRAELESVVERKFHPDSYGYRPGRGAHDALRRCNSRCGKHWFVIDLDIRAFFDTIDHEKLLSMLRQHLDKRHVLLYCKRWLRAPMMQECKTRRKRPLGAGQSDRSAMVIRSLRNSS